MGKLENLKDIIDTNLENLDLSQDVKNRIIQEALYEKRKMKYRRFKLIGMPAVAVIVICLMMFSNIFGSNSVSLASAQDLMKNITPRKVETVKLGDNYIKSEADFSIDLFKNSIKKGENSVISPLSAYLALAMTANGAGGNTLKEFQEVLGKYNLNMDDINKDNYSIMNTLKDVKSGKLNIANSIWYNKAGINVSRSFLQTNADYYGAAAYKDDFSSPEAVDDINNWVKSNTGNLIDKIIDKIDPYTVMYLINTIYFEGEWPEQYDAEQVRKGDFKLDGGKTTSVEFMYSTEQGYLKDDKAQGFIKPYKDNKYSFVALLPNEGVDVDSYAASLTGEKFLSLIKNKSNGGVEAGIPKFKAEYELSLVDALNKMGLKDCFNSELADFGKLDSTMGKKLYISDVRHKAFVQVDNLGTKAGAATSVQLRGGAAKGLPAKNIIILDRPFVYAIIDNQTDLPIFIGTMHNPQ